MHTANLIRVLAPPSLDAVSRIPLGQRKRGPHWMRDVQREFPSSHGTERLTNLVIVADSLLPFLMLVPRLRYGSNGDDGTTDMIIFQSKSKMY